MWVCVCMCVCVCFYHGKLLGPECRSQCTGQRRDIREDFFTWSWCGQTQRRFGQSPGWSWSFTGHPASDGEWEEWQGQKNQWAGEVSQLDLVSPLLKSWLFVSLVKQYKRVTSLSIFAAVFKHHRQNVLTVCVWQGQCFDWASFPSLWVLLWSTDQVFFSHAEWPLNFCFLSPSFHFFTWKCVPSVASRLVNTCVLPHT